MKVVTKVVPRIKEKPPKKTLVINVLCLVIEMIFNTMMPFVLGAYFIITGSLIFYMLFLILLFFNLRFDVKKTYIKIDIVRRL